MNLDLFDKFEIDLVNHLMHLNHNDCNIALWIFIPFAIRSLTAVTFMVAAPLYYLFFLSKVT